MFKVTFLCLVSLFALSPQIKAPEKPCGRYQLIDGPLTEVFDTETGKLYTWIPRDEKTQKEPYLSVKDPISGTVTVIELRGIRQAAR